MFTLRLATLLRRSSFSLFRSYSHVTNVEHRTTLSTSLHNTRLDLDQLLERLDGEAHRRGRLNAGLVRGAMRKAAIEMETIHPTQALLLIRCTGSLLISELPGQRQQVLDHMMKVFTQKNVSLDVTHYNSYMRVSLQNNSFFDPMKVLEQMRTRNIQPNLTSFRLLIECYARQGRSDEIQQILNEMKTANFSIEPLTLTHLLASYAQKGHVERVQSLFELFQELDLKPISETFEQFVISYLQKDQFDQAKKSFHEHASKMENDSLFRLLIQSAKCRQKDLFQSVIQAIDQNSLADVCVQYILCATELFEGHLDDYAFLLIDSFPKRDETLRFDVINYTMLNLLKLRLPPNHFRPFSALTLDELHSHLESSINYQCEREVVTDRHLTDFRQHVLQRLEHFPDKKDRWLVVHQLLHHAYQNCIPLPYIYAIYDTLRQEGYEYRPHYMRPVLVKFQRIFAQKPQEMPEQTRILLDYLQKNFSINYDDETIDLLMEFFFTQCHLTPLEIDTLLKKVNFRLNLYWSNLYHAALKRFDLSVLNSLKVFFNTNKTIRFEYTPTIRDQTLPVLQSFINQWSLADGPNHLEEQFNALKDLIDFVEVMNKRFVKNAAELVTLNDCVLINIVHWFLVKEKKETIDFVRRVFNLFEQRSKSIPLTKETREKVHQQLGLKTVNETKDQLIRSLKKEQEKCSNPSRSISPAESQASFDDSGDIFIKATRNPRTMTIRELEDHLVELKRKKMNPSGVISKLLTKYCTECLDSERTMTAPMRESYMKRIAELESIYFDKKQTTGFPSLGVIAILIDYYSRVELNLDQVVKYINLSNEIDPNFKLDPHKCVSVIRLLIRKDSYPKAIELIDSLGRYPSVPNYMYRRVRDLLIDAYASLPFDKFDGLVNKLLKNNYMDPSAIVLSLIVRKAYHDHGPLQAFETLKTILVQWNSLVGMFPIIRKLLRDDCSEELKQVLIKIGKIRSRTYAYEQLAFALIHERRSNEAVKVCQHISRASFEEHCQRYVRELFFFPSQEEETSRAVSPTTDLYETDHVYDTHTISLIYFLDYIEQYPSNTRHLPIDTLFYNLFKAYEKTNRLEEFTKFMRDHSSKYLRHISSKTKDAFSQAGITLPIKSLTSPKPANRKVPKQERFLQDADYEEDSPSSPTTKSF